ncbi:ATP-binding cassette domain-containing protein [Endozoicomonas sp. Mp262]|uniref:peptidase domain-containing ABC transporter n=1 Tax=Endozoicomonas sp. Mp262 TaxID=2919499 RepID=UPI0021D9AB64
MRKFTLKECFLSICHHLGTDVVNEHLDPLTADSSLDVRQLSQAASRCGLISLRSQRRLTDITEDDLPCIIQLRKKYFLTVTAIKSGRLHVLYGASGQGFWLNIDKVKPLFSGVIFCFIHKSRQRTSSAIAPSWLGKQIKALWPHYIQVVLATVMVNLLTLSLPLFTNMVFDKLIPTYATDTLMIISLGMLGIVVFDFILRWLRSYFVDDSCRVIEKHSEQLIFSRLMELKQSALPDSAGKIAHIIEDFARVKEVLSGTVLLSLLDIPFFALFTLVIWLIGGKMVLIPLTVALVLIPVTWLSYRYNQRNVSRTSRANKAKTAFLFETSSELDSLKLLGVKKKMLARWRGLVAGSSRAALDSKQSNVLLNTLVVSATQLVVIGSLVLGVFLIHSGDITAGGLFACVILGNRAIAPLMHLAMAVNRMAFAAKSLKQINELLNQEGENDSVGKLDVPVVRGEIECDKVSFRFHPDEPEVLKNINLRIKPGEKVAILGASGSGKSTLVRLIQGLLTPSVGNVLVDGRNLAYLNLDDYRSHCAMAPQKPSVFSGTLRSNLLLGMESASSGQMDRACYTAGLDQFVAQCSHGYSHKVQERGNNLSGGQRQALGLARALLRDGKIVILDEPTSAYDNFNESLFCKRLPDILRDDQTLILVTHRHSLLRLVDRIIILADGQIIADGERDKVLQSLSQQPSAQPA